MDKLERLAYWKSVAVDAVRAAGRDGGFIAAAEASVWRHEDDMFAYFDCFRPKGKGLDKVFAGVVGGEEILQRVLKIYELEESSSARGYFIVRKPAPMSPERLVTLTKQHLDKVRQIAINYDEPELAKLLEEKPAIKIMREEISPKTRSDFSAPEAWIYEVTGDWFRSLDPTPSDALLLDEAFYFIACDYKIAHYLLWPLYRNSTVIEDPFAPYFELWTHGALPFFEKPGLVTVYVTGAT